MEKILIELEEIIKFGQHTHVNSQDGTDICKKCGHDLRHAIHGSLERAMLLTRQPKDKP